MSDFKHPSRHRSGHRRTQRPGSAQPHFEARAQSIYQAMQQLATGLWRVHANGRNGEGHVPPMEVLLRLFAEGSPEGNRAAEGMKIVEDILASMDAHSLPGGYREGRVYCYLCESLDCKHASPQGHRFVFTGYGTNGKPEDFCIDSETETMVVIGPHLRTHVFNLEGRLVTSINYSGEEIRKKLLTRRWRPANREEIAAFREAVHHFRDRCEPQLSSNPSQSSS